MLRSYSFTVDFDRQWQALALQKAPSQLCKDVLQLSDQFIQEKQLRTPWNRTNLAAAYELYFHPLNYLRARRSLERAGRHNFFAGLTHVIDWGAGLGAFTRALLDELPRQITRQLTFLAVDESSWALERLRSWNPEVKIRTFRPAEFENVVSQIPWQSTCVALCYSLNEMQELPLLAQQPEAYFLIEPSTHRLARQVQKVRGDLIQRNYSAYAPCPHQEGCPLLTDERDWCHDRVHWEPPELWQKLFKDLPIKNNTLTQSYLAARRLPPAEDPLKGRQLRLVSDELKEKGRTRWWVCASSQRASLAWLSRWGTPPDWKRGDLLAISEQMGQELEKGGEHKVSPESPPTPY